MIETLTEVRSYTSPRGHTVLAETRLGTTDHDSLLACLVEDEYGLDDREWTGVAVDVGAHVGGVSLLLAADNPGLRVVAVEALPDNAAIVRRNIARNGFAADVICSAADRGAEPVTVAYGATGSSFAKLHRFIGGAVWQDAGPRGARVTVPAIGLGALVTEYGPLSLVKIDCEGCEWSFLDDPAVAFVAEFRGEYHPRGANGPARLRTLLEATHVVTLDDEQPFGAFRAVRR